VVAPEAALALSAVTGGWGTGTTAGSHNRPS
jgi:hypothetical protein